MLANRARYPVDHVLLVTVVVLAVFGLIMISSASVYESHQVYVKMGVDCSTDTANCNDFYFWRQFRNIAIALPLFFVAAQIPYLFWRRIALPLFGISLAGLLVLLMPGIAASYGTSRSWVEIPFLNSIQPGEFAKLGLVFYFARWMERRHEEIATFEAGFLPFAIILGLIVGPLALQPDFGSILVVASVATGIYFVAGGRPLHIFGGAAAAGLAGALLVLAMDLEYIIKRFAAFIDPSLDPEGIGFQVKQALIAVGKGGLFGQGLEGATQRFGYLPEVQSDFIFAATGEAFGLLGTLIIAGLFLLIAYRGYRIAARAPDRFGQLAGVGLATLLAAQGFIHIGVNIALLPLTGLTLPFVSYGGSSMAISFVAAGILLNISKYGNVHAASYYREERRG